jgi:hypothetical protein
MGAGLNPRTEAERRPVSPAVAPPKPAQAGVSPSGVVAAMAPQRGVLALATQSLGTVKSGSTKADHRAFAREVEANLAAASGRPLVVVEPVVLIRTPEQARQKIAEDHGVNIQYGWVAGYNKPLQHDLPKSVEVDLPKDVTPAQAEAAGFKLLYRNPLQTAFGAREVVVEVPNDAEGGRRWGELLNKTGSTERGLPNTAFLGARPQMGAAYFKAFFTERPIDGRPDAAAELKQRVDELDPAAALQGPLQAELDNSLAGSIDGVVLIPVSWDDAEVYAREAGVPWVHKPLIPTPFIAVPNNAEGGRIAAMVTQRGFEGHGLSNPLPPDVLKMASPEFREAYRYHAMMQTLVTGAQIAQDLADAFQTRGRGADAQRIHYRTEPSLVIKRGPGAAYPDDPPASRLTPFTQVSALADHGNGPGTIYESGRVPASSALTHQPAKRVQQAHDDLSRALTSYQENPSPRKATWVKNEIEAAGKTLGSADLTPTQRSRIEALRVRAQDALAPPTLTIPREFFADKPDFQALGQVYGLNKPQRDALRGMHPFRRELQRLVDTPHPSADAAAAQAYRLIEKVYQKTPELRSTLEFGAQVYQKDDSQWHVSLPLLGQPRTVSTGSPPRLGKPIAADSKFLHSHPPDKSAIGFSVGDMRTVLQTGRSLYVYQNGRMFRMDPSPQWNHVGEADRSGLLDSLQHKVDAVRASAPGSDAQVQAVKELRRLMQQVPVDVTVFERSGANPHAGERTAVLPILMPVAGSGAIELRANQKPVQPMPAAPDPYAGRRAEQQAQQLAQQKMQEQQTPWQEQIHQQPQQGRGSRPGPAANSRTAADPSGQRALQSFVTDQVSALLGPKADAAQTAALVRTVMSAHRAGAPVLTTLHEAALGVARLRASAAPVRPTVTQPYVGPALDRLPPHGNAPTLVFGAMHRVPKATGIVRAELPIHDLETGSIWTGAGRRRLHESLVDAGYPQGLNGEVHVYRAFENALTQSLHFLRVNLQAPRQAGDSASRTIRALIPEGFDRPSPLPFTDETPVGVLRMSPQDHVALNYARVATGVAMHAKDASTAIPARFLNHFLMGSGRTIELSPGDTDAALPSDLKSADPANPSNVMALQGRQLTPKEVFAERIAKEIAQGRTHGKLKGETQTVSLRVALPYFKALGTANFRALYEGEWRVAADGRVHFDGQRVVLLEDRYNWMSALFNGNTTTAGMPLPEVFSRFLPRAYRQGFVGKDGINKTSVSDGMWGHFQMLDRGGVPFNTVGTTRPVAIEQTWRTHSLQHP